MSLPLTPTAHVPVGPIQQLISRWYWRIYLSSRPLVRIRPGKHDRPDYIAAQSARISVEVGWTISVSPKDYDFMLALSQVMKYIIVLT